MFRPNKKKINIDPSPLVIKNRSIAPGERVQINLEVGKLYHQTEISIPLQVIRGEKDGPTLFVCSAIHGDELNGIEILRRIHTHKAINNLSGTLISVPIVNIIGLINQSRYLPDRKDLNRLFPGSPYGSLGQRMAHLLINEVVVKASHVIDLHTGCIHRYNQPHIRTLCENEEAQKMALAFGLPVVLNSPLRAGSLRKHMNKMNIPTILFEGGEALRFDELSIKAGVKGILQVMQFLGMIQLPTKDLTTPKITPTIFWDSKWVRASRSGLLRSEMQTGHTVKKGEVLGIIGDPMGGNEILVKASTDGVLVGQVKLPLVNKGDALFHIAYNNR